MYSLKNQYKFLFNEELVVLKRKISNYEDEFFDIEFDENNGITKGEKFNVDQNEIKNLIDIVSIYSSVNKVEIYDYILNKKNNNNDGDEFKFRIDISGMDNNQVIDHLNKYFKDIIYWQGKGNGQNQKGRGEAIIHLAFKSDLNANEPDFVSENDSKKYSIKSFIKSNLKSHSQVRTKTTFGSKINEEIENLKNIFDTEKDFLSLGFIKEIIVKDNNIEDNNNIKIKLKPNLKSFNYICFLLVLKYFILDSTKLDKNQKLNKISDIKSSLNNIKKSIANEHGSDGIIAITSNREFVFINSDDAPKELGILSMAGKSRFNICHNKTAPRSNTWIKALKIIETAVKDQDES
jgi:hypothetical protein